MRVSARRSTSFSSGFRALIDGRLRPSLIINSTHRLIHAHLDVLSSVTQHYTARSQRSHQSLRRPEPATTRMLKPPHPGAFVRSEVIEPHGLTVSAGAKVLGVSRPALSTFLNGRSDLSGMMALRIEKAFGVKMDTLMRMQSSYDIARTREREGELDIEPYRPAAKMPYPG